MKENFDASLARVLAHEGGYTNHPKDPGGATNFGVIQTVYDSYRRSHGQMPRSVKFITQDEVSAIYRLLYWNKIEGDALPVGIDYCTMDAAVNSGVFRGAKWLQQAINKCAGQDRLKVDGNIGPATIDAADDYPPHEIINAMIDIRVGFLKSLTRLSPVFGKGWLNRVLGYLPSGATQRRADGVINIAKGMAKSVATPGKYPLPVPSAQPSDTVSPWIVILLLVAASIYGVIRYV